MNVVPDHPWKVVRSAAFQGMCPGILLETGGPSDVDRDITQAVNVILDLLDLSSELGGVKFGTAVWALRIRSLEFSNGDAAFRPTAGALDLEFVFVKRAGHV